MLDQLDHQSQSTTPTLSELQIEVAPLRQHSLYICTPAFDGNVNLNFHTCCLALQQLLIQCGIPHEFKGMGNESLIPRARNRFVNWFLQTKHTHLLFLDADLEFNPIDVLAMLHFQKEVIGAVYSSKGIAWQTIKETAIKWPDITPEDLELVGARWSSHLSDGSQTFQPWTPVEIANLATGFMLIEREVFETLKPQADIYTPHPSEVGMVAPAYDFFPSRVFDGEYLSEDYGFCKLWQGQGGKVYACPWMKLDHWGRHKFKGDLLRVAQLTGVIR